MRSVWEEHHSCLDFGSWTLSGSKWQVPPRAADRVVVVVVAVLYVAGLLQEAAVVGWVCWGSSLEHVAASQLRPVEAWEEMAVLSRGSVVVGELAQAVVSPRESQLGDRWMEKILMP